MFVYCHILIILIIIINTKLCILIIYNWYIYILLGGFNHLEKYESMGRIIPYIMENKIHVWNHQPEAYTTIYHYLFFYLSSFQLSI